jgi:hypothetical protein
MLSIKGREVFEELGRRMDELADLHVRVFLNVSRKPEDTASTAEIVSGFVQSSKRTTGRLDVACRSYITIAARLRRPKARCPCTRIAS